MKKLLLLLFLLCLTGNLLAADDVFIDEEFTSLEQWEPLYFPKIENHSSYAITPFDGTSSLMAQSNCSASAMVLKGWFNIYEHPRLRWRLYVSNIYRKGDSSTKDGDDYPIRLYVMFQFDPEKASFFDKVSYEFAKSLKGKYPPHSSLNYIWANKENAEEIIVSPYSDRAMMIPVARGAKQVGEWVEYSTNMVEDYEKAFGGAPPAMAAIAIMSDSDNTGESAKAYIDYIRISQ